MEIPTEMQHQVMGYDRAATMFSPDGHLLQVEYAEKTVRLGSASLGIVCKDGVVIIADKRIRDRLLEIDFAHKIIEVDNHVMATSAGILADARILIDHAQVLAQQHRVTYGSPVDPISVIRMIADRKQAFTQYGGARPFGVSFMLAGVKKGKPSLYTSDVTGNYFSYRANSIGENDEKIKEMLRKDYKENMTIEEGIKFGLKIFKDILEKNFELQRFEVAYISSTHENITRVPVEELKRFTK